MSSVGERSHRKDVRTLGGALYGCSYYGDGFVLQETRAGTQDGHEESSCHCPHEALHPHLQLWSFQGLIEKNVLLPASSWQNQQLWANAIAVWQTCQGQCLAHFLPQSLNWKAADCLSVWGGGEQEPWHHNGRCANCFIKLCNFCYCHSFWFREENTTSGIFTVPLLWLWYPDDSFMNSLANQRLRNEVRFSSQWER